MIDESPPGGPNLRLSPKGISRTFIILTTEIVGTTRVRVSKDQWTKNGKEVELMGAPNRCPSGEAFSPEIWFVFILAGEPKFLRNRFLGRKAPKSFHSLLNKRGL